MTKLKLSLTEQLKLVQNRANNHLIDFSIATNPKYKPNWHHEEIANELERIESGQFIKDGKKILMVFMPPRHGKSEECTINFPAWYLGRNPDKEIITASYSSDLAVKFGGKTRDLVNGRTYKNIFPNVTLKKGEEGKAEWMTNSNGSYVSVGVGGATTGKGANVFLIDDPIKNAEESESEVFREKVWDWFLSVVWTRLEPNGVVIIILTRWHLDDLAGRILKNDDFKSICKIISYPAIAEINEKHRVVGEALWDWRYSVEEWREIKFLIWVLKNFCCFISTTPNCCGESRV